MVKSKGGQVDYYLEQGHENKAADIAFVTEERMKADIETTVDALHDILRFIWEEKNTGQVVAVQKVDNATHRINHYPADSVVCFVKTYPLDSDLTSG